MIPDDPRLGEYCQERPTCASQRVERNLDERQCLLIMPVLGCEETSEIAHGRIRKCPRHGVRIRDIATLNKSADWANRDGRGVILNQLAMNVNLSFGYFWLSSPWIKLPKHLSRFCCGRRVGSWRWVRGRPNKFLSGSRPLSRRAHAASPLSATSKGSIRSAASPTACRIRWAYGNSRA
jgi:hypothetical protein